MKFCAKVVKIAKTAKSKAQKKKEPRDSFFQVIRLGLEPKTPSLKGMCSTC